MEKMKLSVSAYRAHASAHKKILDTSYNQYYGSTSASHLHPAAGTSGFQVRHIFPNNNSLKSVAVTGSTFLRMSYSKLKLFPK